MSLPSAEEFVRIAAQRLSAVEEASRRGDSSVQQFYRGAAVLITGGTGFLGKHLVEKLLRTCDIMMIYLLVRCRRGSSAEQRLQDILTNPVFESVRAVRPGFAEKIQIIEGDVAQTKLGLADDTWVELTETVTVIFHCAATVGFKEPLWKATEINVKGTVEMLNFGKACKKLRAFVHVSSAYNQAVVSRHLSELPEQFSSSPVSPATLMELVSDIVPNSTDPLTQEKGLKYNQMALEELCAKYIGKEYPNTYSFTKAVSEEAVRTMCGDMPACIIRPTIVICSYTEPTPAWVDKGQILGPSGYILNMLYGVTRAVISDSAVKIDMVPVDIVSNAALTAAWEASRRKQHGDNEIKIYTVSSSCRNHITWGSTRAVLFNEVRQHLSPKAMWYAFTLQTTNKLLYPLLAWLLHTVPAYAADTALLLAGKRPFVANIYKRVNIMSEVFHYFFLYSWVFRDDNLLQMYKQMSPTDQRLFNVDIETVDMKELVILWNLAMRKCILKEDLSGEAVARRRQFVFKLATFAIAPVYFYILYKIFYFMIKLFTFFMYT